MSKIEAIKQKLVRKATELITGGFKPESSMNESWIGRVYLYKEDEEIPTDSNGEQMLPLMQLCVENLPYVPDALQNTKVVTVFVSKKLPMDITPNGQNWLIREYGKEDNLIIKDLCNSSSHIKPFPLKPVLIQEDYPVWDGGGIAEELEDEILEMEDSGEIDDYYDITENVYGHKVGGYPSFCQPGVYFGDGFEFTLQIASDDKANINIVDSGTIFLAKNAKTNEWKYYCDFY